MALNRSHSDGLIASRNRSGTMALSGQMQLVGNTSKLFFQSKGSLQMSRNSVTSSGGFWKSSFRDRDGSGLDKTSRAVLLQIEEVRVLACDAPLKSEELRGEAPRTPHETLLLRLKSRAARLEAEKSRDFLTTYRETLTTDDDGDMDAHFDGLLKALEKRVEELKQRSEELQIEAAEAEKRLESVTAVTVARISDPEFQAMNAFERSQRRIQEDKKEEEVQKQREEVQAHHTKVNRRLQSELIELRDYKVLLREYRRVRLEKLGETIGKVQDGRQLRNCISMMIRNGAQRILQRLESTSIPLEPWMREVLVNCIHVQIRIEDVEDKLLNLRREALQPIRGDVEVMLDQTKQERYEHLFSKTWDMRLISLGLKPTKVGSDHSGAGSSAQGSEALSPKSAISDVNVARRSLPFEYANNAQRGELPLQLKAELMATETELASLRQLLTDMRNNAAAVICNQIQQAEKSGFGYEALQWGRQMLSLLVSEDFAKQTMKELQKLAPTAKLTQ